MNDEYNESTTDIILLIGDGDTIEFTSELRLLVHGQTHTNWHDWQDDNDELLNDTDKLSKMVKMVHVVKFGFKYIYVIKRKYLKKLHKMQYKIGSKY